MKEVVVDTSSLISLSTNCLLWVLDVLKEKVDFYVTKGVVNESINNALRIDRFRLSGVRLLKRLCEGALDYVQADPSLTNKLADAANSIYIVRNKSVKIVHKGEMEAVSAALKKGVKYFLLDERITGTLIDDPYALRDILSNRLHTNVKVDETQLKRFLDLCTGIQVIRSSDLVSITYEKGLMEEYIKSCGGVKVRKDLIAGMLWGLKFSGCAISTRDIKEYLKILI
jgi:hypothetical protein